MGFNWSDPFGVEAKHDEVAEKIRNGEPGYAQTVAGGRRVSWAGGGDVAVVYEAPSSHRDHADYAELIILDLAAKDEDAKATTRAFARWRIEKMIEDRKKGFAKHFNKSKREGAALEALLAERADLFFAL